MSSTTMPGQRFDVGGFHLHAIIAGENAPVIVLEPGLGSFGFQWLHIQRELAKTNKVIAYDRAGQAWSDPSPRPRTPENLSAELHQLLKAAGENPPYILVGHSFGGLLARNYVRQYPGEVLGVVLVDSSYEDEYEIIPNFERMLKMQRVLMRLLSALSKINALGRWMAAKSLALVKGSLARDDWDLLVQAASRSTNFDTIVREYDAFDHYFGPSSEIPKDMGDVPLVVIAAGDSTAYMKSIGKLTPDELNKTHQLAQVKLAQSLSTQGQHVVIEGATHLSIVADKQYADQVSAVILNFIENMKP